MASYHKDLFDWVVIIFLATHIPITLWMDAQSLWKDVPAMTWTVPQFMVDIAADYAKSSGDFLANPAMAPLWFKSILAAEYFLQLPFFVYALIAWLRSWNAPGLRAACIAYGAHVATTLVPIMAEFYFAASLTAEQRVFLLSIYSPYLLLPLAILARAGARPVLFPGKSKAA